MRTIRCSQLARPMVCAGFLFLDFEKSVGGDAAREGTAAGEYLERMLLNKVLGTVASNGVYFDEDMKFHTKPIYDDVEERAYGEVRCEQRIDWVTRSGIAIKGQYDIAFVDNNGTLCIEDLKYGWGIVEAKENWQLLGYAIGEVIRLGRVFDKISLKIHQPRPHHEDGTTREWLLTYNELLEYKEKIELRMEAIVEGERTLNTSKHCKYCDAAAEACPAFSRLFYRALEVSTEFVQDNLTELEIANQLNQIKRADEVIKIKKDSLTELGASRIKKGKIIPGYVTANTYTNRMWNTNVTPESIKMMTGVDVTKSSFMSPAQAEKAGVPKDLSKALSAKRFKGVKLEKGNATDIGNKIFGNPQG